MNIVLIGYRGTGKSVVGKLLSEQLNMPYYGMDAQIVERAGMTIPEIVEKFGWKKFRDMETEVAKKLSGLNDVIIDTGGGVIERSENVAALGQNGRIFWLCASVETIVSRIQDDTQRPSLTQTMNFTEEVASVLEKRLPKYENAADIRIDTDRLAPEQVADKIRSEMFSKSPYLKSKDGYG